MMTRRKMMPVTMVVLHDDHDDGCNVVGSRDYQIAFFRIMIKAMMLVAVTVGAELCTVTTLLVHMRNALYEPPEAVNL